MIPLRPLVLTAGLLCGLSLPAATPLTHLVPEQSAVIISVHDVPEVLSQWEKSPWSKTWNDEQVKRFFAPLREEMKIDQWNSKTKEETGYTLDELMAMATGDALIALTDLSFAEKEGAEDEIPPVLLAVEVGDNASRLEEVLQKGREKEGSTEETMEFAGVTVHTLIPKPAELEEAEEGEDGETTKADRTPTVWAITDGTWLVSPSKDVVLAGIDAIKEGGATNAWGRSERFARLEQRAGKGHVSVLVNIASMYPAMMKAIEAKKAAQAGEQPQGGFDTAGLMTALGIDALNELYMMVDFQDDRTDARFGLTYTEARGLLKVFAYRDGPLELPAYVSPKWVGASTGKFSFKDFYAGIEEILEAFNPAISGLVQGQIRNLNKQLGVDLKRDLIGSLGETVVSGSMISPRVAPGAQPTVEDFEQVIAISLENPAAFEGALEALKRMMGPQAETMFKTREYLGHKLVSMEMPAASPEARQKGFSYAIAKGTFFMGIGSASPVESALQGLASNRGSLWETPAVREALAQLPANASVFQYQDTKAVIPTVFETVVQAAGMMNQGNNTPEFPEGEGDDVIPEPEAKSSPVDPAAKPDPAVIAKYWSYGWGYLTRDSQGFQVTSRVVYPK